MVEVSILIVNYNGRNLLKICLDSINKILSIKNKKNYEIIVVDNNSGDGSIDFVRKNYKYARIVQNKKNLGYCGINSALPYCKGKYILFLNNDIRIEKNCIEELVKALKKDRKIVMAAPRLVNYYDKSLKSQGTWVSRAFYNGHIPDDSNITEIPYLGVGLIRKDAVDKFGYIFDPDYFIYGEDLDLGLRIRLIGCKVVFVRNAVLQHLHAATAGKFQSSFTTFLLERNLLTTFFKIFSLKNTLIFLPFVFLMRLLAIAKDIVNLRFSNAFARIKAVFWVLLNFSYISKKRSQIQKMRQADDAYILEVFSEKYLLRKPVII